MEAYGFVSAGAEPQKHYFDLNLFEEIDVDVSTKTVSIENERLNFVLRKADPSIWWTRLTAQPQKQNWILIDEELWVPRNSNEFNDGRPEYRDIRLDYPGIDEYVQQEELGYRRGDWKTTYLVLYNLFQLVGFLYVLIVIAIGYYRDGYEKLIGQVYETTGNALKLCQLLQYLEVMHPMFGYTRGSALTPFLHITGRNFVLFMMIEAEPRAQTKPVILFLIVCWSTIECIRYPYYVLSLMNHENSLLTWLRYTAWIPLYPFGGFCEGIIMLRNIPYFEETGKFGVSMPNKWNFSFHMPTFIMFYLVFGLVPGIYFLMAYMAKLRKKKLHNEIKFIRNNNGKAKRYTI